MSRQPSDEEFDAVIAQALDALPAEIAQHTENVIVRVADFADEDVLAEMGIGNAYELLGLYQGVSIDQKSMFDPMQEPDFVFLYKYPILAYAEDEAENPIDVIRHVLIHEIGHHFGFSDEDMHLLEEED